MQKSRITPRLIFGFIFALAAMIAVMSAVISGKTETLPNYVGEEGHIHITEKEVNNAEYDLGVGGIIKLKDGMLEQGKVEDSNFLHAEISKKEFKDLNGDGRGDAHIVLRVDIAGKSVAEIPYQVFVSNGRVTSIRLE